MIKRIVIRDVASYDHEGCAFEDLKKVNIIYGGNGTGKTTLSRALEKGDEGCEVEWDGEQVEVLVYNKDFKERNLQEFIPGVFTLGEATTEAVKEVESLKEEVKKKREEIKRKETEIDQIGKVLEQETLALHETLWKTVYKPNEGFTECMRGGMSKKQFAGKLIELRERATNSTDTISSTDDKDGTDQIGELKGRYETVFGKEEPQRMRTFTTPVGLLTQTIAIASDPIWKRRIVGSDDVPIAALIKKLDMAGWVRQGQELIRKDSDVCPFCQKKTIDAEFRRELETFFDENYLRDIETINRLKDRYVELSTNVIKELANTIETEKMEQTGKLDLKLFSAHVEILRGMLTVNWNLMQGKASDPGQQVSFKDVSEEMGTLKTLTDQANAAIGAHNRMVDNITMEREKLKRDVWRYMTAQAGMELDAYIASRKTKRESISSRREQKDAEEQACERLEQRIKEKEHEITSTQPTITHINQALKHFGFTNFSIQQAPGGLERYYQIQRSDGSLAAQSLSEGEVTFITFLYFMQLVDGGSKHARLSEPRVVVLDDPISSLDSNVLFVVSTMVRQMMWKVRTGKEGGVKQVFVLTHNIYFHKEVSFVNTRNNRRKDTHYWVMYKQGDTTRVKGFDMDNPIRGSYELLWGELREWKDHIGDMDNIRLQNVLRRIIENYFVMFGGYKRQTLIPENFSDDPEEMSVAMSFARWIDEGSHDLMDDLYVESPQTMNEKYVRVFKRLFEKLGHLAHYEMMMKCGE